jgi:RNA polymerase sigma-70 factor, ECF subfamily
VVRLARDARGATPFGYRGEFIGLAGTAAALAGRHRQADARNRHGDRTGQHATAGAPAFGRRRRRASDDTLMVSYCAGDAAAFDALYARYRRPIYRFFLRQLPQARGGGVPSGGLAEADQRPGQLPGAVASSAPICSPSPTTPSPTATGAMKHGVIDHEADADAIADGAPDPEAITAQGREAARLYRHLAALPVAQREALLMKESAGLSLAEIARITETSEEGVKSRIRYAMQKLRQAMNGGEVTGREVPGP